MRDLSDKTQCLPVLITFNKFFFVSYCLECFGLTNEVNEQKTPMSFSSQVV